MNKSNIETYWYDFQVVWEILCIRNNVSQWSETQDHTRIHFFLLSAHENQETSVDSIGTGICYQ